jgi:hypothetical protein
VAGSARNTYLQSGRGGNSRSSNGATGSKLDILVDEISHRWHFRKLF